VPARTPPTTFFGREVRSGLDPLRSNYARLPEGRANQIARAGFNQWWTGYLRLRNHKSSKSAWVELVFTNDDCSWRSKLFRFRYHVCNKINRQRINFKRRTKNRNQGICRWERCVCRPSNGIRQKFNLSSWLRCFSSQRNEYRRGWSSSHLQMVRFNLTVWLRK